jgi:hypothetical protein
MPRRWRLISTEWKDRPRILAASASGPFPRSRMSFSVKRRGRAVRKRKRFCLAHYGGRGRRSWASVRESRCRQAKAVTSFCRAEHGKGCWNCLSGLFGMFVGDPLTARAGSSCAAPPMEKWSFSKSRARGARPSRSKDLRQSWVSVASGALGWKRVCASCFHVGS